MQKTILLAAFVLGNAFLSAAEMTSYDFKAKKPAAWSLAGAAQPNGSLKFNGSKYVWGTVPLKLNSGETIDIKAGVKALDGAKLGIILLKQEGKTLKIVKHVLWDYTVPADKEITAKTKPEAVTTSGDYTLYFYASNRKGQLEISSLAVGVNPAAQK